jgi:cysteine desulfurase/selenocysteine lyase
MLTRADFPIFAESEATGPRLTYLDSASTAQRPRAVLEAMDRYYRTYNSNVHRGVHHLSQRATDAFERTRRLLSVVLNAADSDEIIFTKGCTEAINLVAHSHLAPRLSEGDEICVTELEHHANLVPWQLVAQDRGATIRGIPVLPSGELDISELDQFIHDRTRMVAVTHFSNALGTMVPLEPILRRAREVGAATLIDGAQAGAHGVIDVRELDVDFYVLSGHKQYGPTGVGALYGRRSRLEAMRPYQAGGGMIQTVELERSTYAPIPARFEPGTPNIAGFIGWGAALEAIAGVSPGTDFSRDQWEAGVRHLMQHEAGLKAELDAMLETVPGLRRLGPPERIGIASFVMDGIHPHDVGSVLDQHNVAVRTGHHCCQPLMRKLRVPATARASLGAYNTTDDISALHQALQATRTLFGS